jgi:anti-sigma B factor antagonist
VVADGDGTPLLDLRVEAEDASVVLRLRGDLDMAAVGVLTAAFAETFTAAVTDVVVDLSQVDFLDSSGIRALLDGRERAQRAGAVLTVRHPVPLVETVLRVSGVAGYLGLPPRPTP